VGAREKTSRDIEHPCSPYKEISICYSEKKKSFLDVFLFVYKTYHGIKDITNLFPEYG
jgi:hypothetical protein